MPDRTAPEFIVYTTGYAGIEKPFHAYSDADAANAVAQQLNTIGCPARVVTTRTRRSELADSDTNTAE